MVESFRNESFKRLNHSGTNHSHVAQKRKTVMWLFVIKKNWGVKWHLKHKYLNVNLLFIELLYKINITFVTVLILKKKRHSSCDF